MSDIASIEPAPKVAAPQGSHHISHPYFSFLAVKSRLAVITFVVLTATFRPIVFAQQISSTVETTMASPQNPFVGNEPCAVCHADIYKTYSSTAMARASGAATDHLIAGAFQHAPSRVHYRVYEQNGDAWLSFERTADPAVQNSSTSSVQVIADEHTFFPLTAFSSSLRSIGIRKKESGIPPPPTKTLQLFLSIFPRLPHA